MNIQEVCKIRKEELKLTYQEISDTSGVPLSTVQNFFSKFSKARLFTPSRLSARRWEYRLMKSLEFPSG